MGVKFGMEEGHAAGKNVFTLFIRGTFYVFNVFYFYIVLLFLKTLEKLHAHIIKQQMKITFFFCYAIGS